VGWERGLFPGRAWRREINYYQLRRAPTLWFQLRLGLVYWIGLPKVNLKGLLYQGIYILGFGKKGREGFFPFLRPTSKLGPFLNSPGF